MQTTLTLTGSCPASDMTSTQPPTPLQGASTSSSSSSSLVARLASSTDWGDEVPRAWQVDAMRALSGVSAGERVMVTAVMGAGKARFAAELVRRAVSAGVPVVLSTSTVALVEQLSADVARRIGADQVGRYYTHGADIEQPVIVTCIPSMPDLARDLVAAGRGGGLWIADEAHKTECAGAIAFAETYQPQAAVGLSATPYRASESATLSLWDREAFGYRFGDAIRDGVLVPFRLHFHATRIETQEQLDDACEAWIRTRKGSGIVDARNIADAVAFAQRLSDAGVAALPIHSQLSTSAKRAALDRLRSGDLRCLVHVQMLTEGVDIPFLTWGCLRRKRGSRVENAQHIGRYLRAYPNKAFADIYDPWEILPTFGLDSPAALGEALEQAGDAPLLEAEPEPETDPLTGETVKQQDKAGKLRIVRHTAASRFLAAAATALRAAGVCDPAFGAGKWRQRDATAAQQASLDRLTGASGTGGMAYALRREVKHPEAVAVGHCARWYREHENRGKLRAGILSDLQSVIYACHSAKIDRTVEVLRRFGVDPEPVLTVAGSPSRPADASR